MKDGGSGVEDATNAMTRILLDYSTSTRLGQRLNHTSNLAVRHTRTADVDGGIEAVARSLDELVGRYIGRALGSNHVGGIEVAMKAVVVQRDIWAVNSRVSSHGEGRNK